MNFTVVIPGTRARNFKYFASANAYFKTGSLGTTLKSRNTGKAVTRSAVLPLH